nr:uncharacterized protein LOC105323550 isoform X4 [Crassostrea gigas]
MDQPTLQELTEHGQKMELKGSDLQKFIRDQQAHYRELRAAEREREKEAREYELKKQTLEMDRIKMQEEQDDIDSYLRRFERYAEAQKWKPDTWAVNLSALLRGRALDVYALLPQEQALNYDALKTSLLKRFERTEDGFRQRFRMCRPESGETFSQFSVRLGSYLNRWIELGRVPNTFDGLYDLVLRDQFLSMCNRDLLLFLKERIPQDIDEMCRLADQYKEARHVNILSLVHSGRKESTTELRNGSPNIQRDQKEQKSTKDAATTEKQVRCYKCSKIGHASFQCPQQRSRPREDSRSGHPYQTPGKCSAFTSVTTTTSVSSPKTDDLVSTSSCNVTAALENMPSCDGRLNEHSVSVLRDTGCNGVVVRKDLICDSQLTGKRRECVLADGSKIKVPVACVSIDTPYFIGEVEAWCLKNPLYDVIIGNIPDARDPKDPDMRWSPSTANAVLTRQQARHVGKKTKPICVPDIIDSSARPADILREQEGDDTLEKIRGLVGKDTDADAKVHFIKKKGMIYRTFQSSYVENGKKLTQLIVPKKFRTKVLALAHEAPMSGHLGISRTIDRVLAEFYWPGVQSDVRRFCQSCDICQRTTPKGRTTKVPLGKMPLIDEPFKRVAVDLVGPIQPATDRGNRYILTLVDFASRYPEAVALKGIEAERVAEALVEIFCRLGVPVEMLTDMGSQFTSELMAETSRLLSFRQLTTTPYHPMCNGLVERFNGTLKQMLRRLCAERPKDWDRYLSAALFAYRDTTQESLGFSPFELVYGHTVRGPMRILRELWTKEVTDPDIKTTYQYVVDLKDRLQSTCELAKENLERSSQRYRTYYNKRARQRDMKEGEKVLVLLPTASNKLLMQWRGPYIIVQKVGSVDYKIDVDGKLKTFHANMLKRYVDRQDDDNISRDIVGVAVIDVENDSSTDDSDLNDSPSHLNPEGPENVNISDELGERETRDIKTLLCKYSDVLTDAPGLTTLAKHEIRLTSENPVRTKPYPLPFTSRETVCEEVRRMLETGIIEPSTSPYTSPIVIVKKKDGSNRFCIDFRAINRITVFDAETIPCADDIFVQLAGSKYVSKFDLCKGYWQLPLEETSKCITAFQTPLGLFQFKVMPFGLVNASASFSRLMRKLLEGMQFIDNFIDDVIIYTKSFQEHLQIVEEFLERLRAANLTAKPSKCYIGFQSLECLGHIAGEEKLLPVPEKVAAIQEFTPPTTKKQVRSFLGLVGFYRRFIPNFSAIAAPLTDLTRKGQPNKCIWGQQQENAFTSLKYALMVTPVLKLPDISKPFILQTDASDAGVGAVLLQEEDGVKKPVFYASQKLKSHQLSYSTIEKECYAIVWAVQKFQRFQQGSSNVPVMIRP